VGVNSEQPGTALRILGERENGTARLEEALTAYRAALEERTHERVPREWAITQNHLGTALRTLGERERGNARLEEALAAGVHYFIGLVRCRKVALNQAVCKLLPPLLSSAQEKVRCRLAFRPEIRGRGHPAGIHAASHPAGGTSRPRRALCAGRLGFADIDRATAIVSGDRGAAAQARRRHR
jgi:hypothetical protein